MLLYSKCSVNSAIPEAVCAMLAQWVLHCTCMEAGPQPHSLEPAFIELHMALFRHDIPRVLFNALL